MRTLHEDIIPILAKLLDDGVVTFAVAIGLSSSEALYLTPNAEPFEHQGRTFHPYPMSLADFEDSGDGDLPSTSITLTNVGRLPMPYLEAMDWDQAPVTIYFVYAKDTSIDFGIRLDFAVQSAVATHTDVTLSLGQPNYFDKKFPGRRFLRAAGFPGIPRNVH